MDGDGPSQGRRRRWMDEVVARAVSGLLGRTDPDGVRQHLTEPFQSDAGLALVALRAAAADVDGQVPEETDALLRQRAVTIDTVLDILIRPCQDALRRDGAPWRRHWDTMGLHHLVFDIWRAQIRATLPRTEGDAAVSRYLAIDQDAAARLATPTTDDVPSPSLLDAVRAAGGPTPSAGDDDLAWVQDLAAIIRWVETTDGAGTSAVAEPLARDLVSLTDHEVDLLHGEPDAYAEWAMGPGPSRHDVWLQTPGAIPAASDAGRPAPPWMQDSIVRGGGRILHERIPPYALWVATAETAEQLRLMEGILSSRRLAVALMDGDDVGELAVLLDPDDPEGPAATFTYDLSFAAGAWDLLHLAMTRRVRFTLLRMLDEEPLVTLGTLSFPLGGDLPDRLRRLAVTALRDAVGTDEHRLRGAVHDLVTAEEVEQATFTYVDHAKGEDLLLDLLANDPRRHAAWGAFGVSRQAVGAAWQELIVREVDGDDPTEARRRLAEVEATAGRRREEALGRQPPRSGTVPQKLARWARTLPEGRTAMVHLHQKDGYFEALWLRNVGGTSEVGRVDLSHFDPMVLGAPAWQAVHATAEQLRHEGWTRPELLEAMVAAASPVMASIHEAIPEEVDRLVISPTRPLDVVPLHAVPLHGRGSERTCDRYRSITYVPSLDIATALAALPAATGDPLLVGHAGHLDVDGMQPISGPTQEVSILADLYPGAAVLAAADASPGSVLAGAHGRPMLHVASHGMIGAHRWANGLVLEGETLGTAMLTASAIAAAPRGSMPRLVILCACRTGADPERRAVLETARGVDGAFLANGARCVISTLWPVGDVTALVFSVALHTALAGGDTIDRSFSGAIDLLRSEGNPPPGTNQAGAASRLDGTVPGWRGLLHAEGSAQVAGWGAFRILGVPWR